MYIYGLYTFIITQKTPIGKDKLSRPTQYCTIFVCHDLIFKNVLNIFNDPLLKNASLQGFFLENHVESPYVFVLSLNLQSMFPDIIQLIVKVKSKCASTH